MAVDGIKWYENDGASDWLIGYDKNPVQAVEYSLNQMLEGDDPDYSEVDECTHVVAAAHILAAIRDGDISQIDGHAVITNDLRNHSNVNAFVTRSIAALERVLNEDVSELSQLLQEDGQDYPAWRKQIETLILRLAK